MKTFEAQTAAQWHTWLAKHHDSESEVWLVFYKAHTGRRSIALPDTKTRRLQEAIRLLAAGKPLGLK